MVQNKNGLTTPPEQADEAGPGEWFPEGEVASLFNLNDLPELDEMGILFEDELMSDIPEPDLALAGVPVFDELADSLAEAIKNGESQEMALIPVERVAAEATGSPKMALAPASLFSQERYLVFTLAGARYAVPMSQVLEVAKLGNFTPVPNLPDWILGITSLRGDIVSIVDLRALLNLEPEDHADNHNLLVTQTFEGDITACLVVEQVAGIAHVSASQIQTIDTVSDDRLSLYVRGVQVHDGGLLSVLNLEGLLQSLDIAHYRP